MIYLDNAATTMVSKEVLDEMLPYFTEDFGNPDSVHAAAKKPREAIAEAERRVRENLIRSSSGKIIFTSGGTESNNMALNLCTSTFPLVSRIVTSATEHKSVLVPAKRCGDRRTTEILRPGGSGGIREPLNRNAAFTYALHHQERTLFSFMHMNNETGIQNSVYAIGDMLTRNRALTGLNNTFFHVDCVQSAGELRICPEDMGADLVSVSAHKFHGPKGVGCLWVSDRLLDVLDLARMKANKPVTALEMIIGGGQQGGLRGGTLNVPGIVGLGAAASHIARDGWKTVAEVSDAFANSLMHSCVKRKIPMPVFHFGKHGPNKPSYAGHDPKILSIGFPGADAETVVMIASENGLCISNGAACNSVSSEPSYVLLASGISPDLARSTVRVSFSVYNTVAECQEGAEILAESVKEALSLTDLLP